MYQWQDLLGNGNRCFNNQDYLQAEYYYQQARADLENLWSQDCKNSSLLLAWIRVSHNISALFELQGKTEQALHYLHLPHQHLLTLSQMPGYDDDIQLIASNALKLTLPPLLEFAHQYPICGNCLKKLTELHQQLFQERAQLH